jgi:hypothetical protein
MVLSISDFLANAFESLITNERHYFVLHLFPHDAGPY